MDRNVWECLVTQHQALVPSLALPDPNDRDVLAAAITDRCDAFFAQTLRDFPTDAIAPFGIEAIHPDELLTNQLSLASGLFCSAIQKVRARLKNPPCSPEE
ncbi:hypothetical protein ACFOGJ_23305 [Marinibaculum pumilum]|uniref:VapC50 C-terminal domain-containing protein n=1 Tax=Marinibaculum pumilum TaxID=1766165 RepID=A0ABV7L6G5_9PROT